MKDIQQPLPTVAGPRRSRLGRERHIITVLTRHGFGLLVQHSRLPIVRRAGSLGRPDALRKALEELGTTFVKLGQILSTRPDLLPEEYIDALTSLQDSLAPIDFDAVRGVVERELGAPPEKLFAYFDPVPMATASIGQVHAAGLPDGTSLVVKVQKPGIAAEVELDLQIVHNLSRLAAARIDLPLIWNLEEIVDQFSDGLREEVDYLHEARNAERFARLVADDTNLVVPAVHWDFTTSTCAYPGSRRRREDQRSCGPGTERRRSLPGRTSTFGIGASTGVRSRLFSRRPDPGNYLVRGDGVIGIVDFGLMGVLDEGTRRDLLLLLASWVREDADGLTDGLLALGVARIGTSSQELRSDMRRVLGRYHDARLQDIALGKVLADLFRLARRHHLVLRGELALMAKTLAMHEGLGSRLDPQFHLVEEARPYVEKAMRRL